MIRDFLAAAAMLFRLPQIAQQPSNEAAEVLRIFEMARLAAERAETADETLRTATTLVSRTSIGSNKSIATDAVKLRTEAQIQLDRAAKLLAQITVASEQMLSADGSVKAEARVQALDLLKEALEVSNAAQKSAFEIQRRSNDLLTPTDTPTGHMKPFTIDKSHDTDGLRRVQR